MKRMVAVALAMLLAVMPVVVYGEEAAEIDLTEMSLIDLLTARNRYDAEIARRSLTQSTSTVPTGRYVAGVDIIAGTYMATFVSMREKGGSVDLYTMKDGRTDMLLFGVGVGEGTYHYLELNIGDSFYLPLIEGRFLKVDDCEIILTPHEPDWKPKNK